MNRSRIRGLEKLAMPKPDAGSRILILEQDFHSGMFYHLWSWDRPFRSENEAIDACEAEHGKLHPRATVIVSVRKLRASPLQEGSAFCGMERGLDGTEQPEDACDD